MFCGKNKHRHIWQVEATFTRTLPGERKMHGGLATIQATTTKTQ
jgi:hypothetical protein